MPDETIVAVLRDACAVDSRRLLIGILGHDHLVQPFQAPAMAHQIRCKPVQKFRVRGWGAHIAKVAWSIHNAVAEVALPDTVNDNSRGERIVRIADPVG